MDNNRFLLIRESDLENFYEMINLFHDATKEIFETNKINTNLDFNRSLGTYEKFMKKQSFVLASEEQDLTELF